MEAKSRPRNTRVPTLSERYIIESSQETIKVLPCNFPRFSGKRTHRDSEFLSFNDGKLLGAVNSTTIIY